MPMAPLYVTTTLPYDRSAYGRRRDPWTSQKLVGQGGEEPRLVLENTPTGLRDEPAEDVVAEEHHDKIGGSGELESHT